MDKFLVYTHIICMLLSYVAFLAAFLSGIVFLLQEKQLKRKQMGTLFYSLPSLEQIDRINLLAIRFGFVLLTVGVLSGFIGARIYLGAWWSGDPKEYLSLALWGWYLLLWWVRMRSTLRGRRVALLSILGFSFVVMTFLGARLLLASGHPYL